MNDWKPGDLLGTPLARIVPRITVSVRPNGTRKCIACRRQHRMAHYYRNRATT